jgi:hypothetical protein
MLPSTKFNAKLTPTAPKPKPKARGVIGGLNPGGLGGVLGN